MSKERRTEVVLIRFTPSLRAALEADRLSKGQPLVEWFERATRAALAGGCPCEEEPAPAGE